MRIPRARIDARSKRHTYEIAVTSGANAEAPHPQTWSVTRRYSEFWQLRADLGKAFGKDGLQGLPEFPAKTLFSTNTLVRTRRAQLEAWLAALVSIPRVLQWEGLLRFVGALSDAGPSAIAIACDT